MGLAVVGLLGGLLVGWLTYGDLHDRLDALPRTPVPGQVSLDVDEPQGLTIFHEAPAPGSTFGVRASGDTTLPQPPVTVTVTGPAGPVATQPYEADLRFDVGDRVAAALATFDAEVAGTYTVQVSGDAAAGVQVSAGHVVDGWLVGRAIAAVGVFVATWLVATTMVLVVAIRRSARRQPRDVEAPPLARV